MKQIMQDMSSGETRVIEAPIPQMSENHLLIETSISLISTGTERMLVDFGKANMLQKVRQQPDKVRQVLEKVQTDGLMTTVEAVRSKLGQPLPLGYCNVGRVINADAGITHLQQGDRVVSNGPHADIVRVPKNLTAKIPDSVSDETASFTVVAAIGLQGIRLAQPSLGEAFVVTGVGLIGLLTVQMLRAQGCRVLAIDFDAAKLELAKAFGAETCNPGTGEDPVAAGIAFSRGRGVDGVIITASTKSSDPVSQAAKMSRQRARIVLVGVTGLDLSRADFYEKELSFQVSCSYGPGRYDPAYEEDGQDYPYGLVRWTEQRNFEAALDLMASGQIDVSRLVTHRFAFESAVDAYQVLVEDKAALGIILNYDHPKGDARQVSSVILRSPTNTTANKNPIVGVIGAGNYSSRVLIPAFKAAGARLHSVASSGGVSSVIHGTKNDFEMATSDTDKLINGAETNIIVIATRHNTHAKLTEQGLRAGKHVFVEKPLALNSNDLTLLETAHAETDGLMLVGFNRRFAPQVQKIKQLLSTISAPKTFTMTMNAGAIPGDHWTQSLEVGGGRILGEACHYVDLMRFLVGAPITSVQARRMGRTAAEPIVEDKAVIVLGFADGSFGTIHYLANGGAAFPKERIEVFVQGRTLQLDNFLKLTGFNWPGFRKMSSMRQDKGQNACVQAFLDAIREGGPSPIPAEELFEVARVTLEVSQILQEQND